MPSATELIGPSGVGLLRASDLPPGTNQITVVFDRVEHLENLASPLIAYLTEEVVPGRGAIPLNKTNIRALVQFLGDDYSEWAGAKVSFLKVPVTNPRTGSATWGLRVASAETPERVPWEASGSGSRAQGKPQPANAPRR
jgi:hypothetical protein